MTSDTTSLPPAFLPTTPQELKVWGWDRLDVVLVTGDTYIDSPYIGAAVIGRVLVKAGYRVGLIAQPDVKRADDITRLGEPALFWGVTGGSVDSLVANRTALNKPRKSDDLTPGGLNNRRPDRAVIAYCNLIRRYFKQTRPIVLGGIEASLRRISHYDAWSETIRRAILFDAKADILVYGMGEQTIVSVARALQTKADIAPIRGICYIRPNLPPPCRAFIGPDIQLPSHDQVCADSGAFGQMFSTFYRHCDPQTAHRLIQQQDTRLLIHNPPPMPMTPTELDQIFELPYMRDVHPFYAALGPVRALETIQFALTTHRGCYGECRFCAITVHQGRQVVSRSQASVLREATRLTRHPRFKGIIADAGGPTANMYGFECQRKMTKGACAHKGCLYPETCHQMPVSHRSQIELLTALRQMPGVRKVFVGSGIRYDLILADQRHGRRYLQALLQHHVSGQLKIAPEHVQEKVLRLMGKPGPDALDRFLTLFQELNRSCSGKVFLTYYMMAAHPGCTLDDMRTLRRFSRHKLNILPKQVQIFTPSPSTFSTLMYCTGIDPFSGRKIFVEKALARKMRQKDAVRPLGDLSRPPRKFKKRQGKQVDCKRRSRNHGQSEK